jgi:hypothetical protein
VGVLKIGSGLKSWSIGQEWGFMPVISALRRLRQGNHEFETKLGYIARSYLKKQKQK